MVMASLRGPETVTVTMTMTMLLLLSSFADSGCPRWNGSFVRRRQEELRSPVWVLWGVELTSHLGRS